MVEIEDARRSLERYNKVTYFSYLCDETTVLGAFSASQMCSFLRYPTFYVSEPNREGPLFPLIPKLSQVP